MNERIVWTAIFVALAGCAHAPSIVGSWSVQGGPGPATMTFGADGNFKVSATMPGRSSTVTGQYKLDGNHLTLIAPGERSATVQFNSPDEMVVTGDDGVAKTLKREK